MPEKYQQQTKDEIFALDIGTRSIIGIVGRVEGGRLRVLAIEKENHNQRAMLDGQIEDIDRVAEVARVVVRRLESKLKRQLTHVCLAAAGRALKSERAEFKLELSAVQQITEEIVGQLEAGAVSKAEEVIMGQPDQQSARFYMVGYTASQYRLDGYPLLTLKGHSGRVLEVDVVATFLPREVVDSLYAVVGQMGLEVSSLTLEPIASLNAAIPTDIRLLNLVLVDIGAGTSDIAICQDGSVVGYTMATVAGDEITERLMRSLLVDFQTGERMKTELSTEKVIRYTDILSIQHEMKPSELQEVMEPGIRALAQEICKRILELNEKVPSAVFLAGGGSKLSGLRECVAAELKIDAQRVAVAGDHFDRNAFSDDYDIHDPEYATPLGIAISSGLGLINDSYVVTLNGEPAKLFRSGTLTLRDILLMNGYHYADLIGRTGANLSFSLNGERMFFRGAPATPPDLTLNGRSAELSAVTHAGDCIVFRPAVSGADAAKTLADLVGEDFTGQMVINGAVASLGDSIHTGDEVWVDLPDGELPTGQTPAKPAKPAKAAKPAKPDAAADSPGEPPKAAENVPGMVITMNGASLDLPPKPNGEPYYLMDLLEYSDVDFDHLEKPVELWVNGVFGQFSQIVRAGDNVVIE